MLVSYSQPHMPTNDSSKTMEHSIAYCARVSNPENQHNSETDHRLLKYLIKHHHWSPFEMSSICLEINSTRDICRQIIRHRTFSFQEFSQRYADATVIGFETREGRIQDTKNRQNSFETDDKELLDEWELKQQEILELSSNTYKWALVNGIAKEQARVVLPEGMTHSRMYMNGTLRSWIHYIQLRTGNGTQKEHREVALQCAKTIATFFPMILDFVTID